MFAPAKPSLQSRYITYKAITPIAGNLTKTIMHLPGSNTQSCGCHMSRKPCARIATPLLQPSASVSKAGVPNHFMPFFVKPACTSSILAPLSLCSCIAMMGAMTFVTYAAPDPQLVTLRVARSLHGLPLLIALHHGPHLVFCCSWSGRRYTLLTALQVGFCPLG